MIKQTPLEMSLRKEFTPVCAAFNELGSILTEESQGNFFRICSLKRISTSVKTKSGVWGLNYNLLGVNPEEAKEEAYLFDINSEIPARTTLKEHIFKEVLSNPKSYVENISISPIRSKKSIQMQYKDGKFSVPETYGGEWEEFYSSIMKYNPKFSDYYTKIDKSKDPNVLDQGIVVTPQEAAKIAFGFVKHKGLLVPSKA
ncbi:hypothetical protein ACFLZZ_00505 [Nanoarchaeota archaeon]